MTIESTFPPELNWTDVDHLSLDREAYEKYLDMAFPVEIGLQALRSRAGQLEKVKVDPEANRELDSGLGI